MPLTHSYKLLQSYITVVSPFGLVADDLAIERGPLDPLIGHIAGSQRPLSEVLDGLGLTKLSREQGGLATGFQEGICLQNNKIIIRIVLKTNVIALYLKGHDGSGVESQGPRVLVEVAHHIGRVEEPDLRIKIDYLPLFIPRNREKIMCYFFIAGHSSLLLPHF